MKYIKNYNQIWATPFKWTYTGRPLVALLWTKFEEATLGSWPSCDHVF